MLVVSSRLPAIRLVAEDWSDGKNLKASWPSCKEVTDVHTPMQITRAL